MIAAPIEIVHGPHDGPQTDYFAIDADIIVYGGAAGGGKSWCLLVDPLRWIHLPGFNAVILRRDSEQIRQAGGLWDASTEIYPLVGGVPREHTLDWRFGKNRITFDSMLYEKDKLKYQGAEIAMLGFDELTHFTESQFWYLQSRNRSKCDIRPYTRATCNPDPNSWVKDFIAPWIDEEFEQDGEPFNADPGEVVWIVRNEDDSISYYWDEPAAELEAMTLTFIPADLDDNPTLDEKDPEYRKKLMQMPKADRERLLRGNWEIMEGGNMFKPEWFEVLDPENVPECVADVWFWDMAATKPRPGFTDPDWTVGTHMGTTRFGRYIVKDVRRIRDTPSKVEELVAATAAEFPGVPIRMEQEGGSSGKSVIDMYRRLILPGYDFSGKTVQRDKTTRAKPFAGQAEHGNVSIVKGRWNKPWLNELAPFPDPKVHDDQVDSGSGAHQYLATKRSGAKMKGRKGKWT